MDRINDEFYNRRRYFLQLQQDDDVITVSSDGSESPILFEPEVTPLNIIDLSVENLQSPLMQNLQEVASSESSRQGVIVSTSVAIDKIEPSTSTNDEQKEKENHEKKRAIQTVDDLDEGDTCAICLESWSNAGDHRLCALHCGHVFGYSCITRWMATSKHICPTCKNKILKQDIRFIYAKKLVAIDTLELEAVKQQLEDSKTENAQLQMQIYEYRSKEGQWLCRQRDLEMKIERLQHEINDRPQPLVNSNTFQPLDYSLNGYSLPRRLNLYRDKTVEITKDGGCRSIAFIPRMNMMIASAKRTDNLFPGYGVSFLDLNGYRLASYQRLHGLEIRDLSYNPISNLLATVSIDKTLKLLDCSRSSGAVSTYTTDCPLWSCCWDLNDPYNMYIGSQKGDVTMLDQRNLARAVFKFDVSEDYGAVVAMHSLPWPRKLGGLVVCKLQSCWFYDRVGIAPPEIGRYKLMGPGPFFSMCVDPKTKQIFVSARARLSDNPQEQYIKHTLLYVDEIEGRLVPNIVHTYHGGFVQTKISRPCFHSANGTTEGQFVAAYHETDKKVYMWSVSTGMIVGFLPALDNVMGITGIDSPFNAVATLTDKKMEFHKVIT